MFDAIFKAVRVGGALVSTFQAYSQGVPLIKGLEISTLLIDKINGFTEYVNKEHTQVALLFSKNCYDISVDYTKANTSGSPIGWNDYFDILNASLATTNKPVEALGNENESQSLGRIQYRADILQKWYQAQDSRLHPVFEAFGRVNTVSAHFYYMYPMGHHGVNYQGKEFTRAIS